MNKTKINTHQARFITDSVVRDAPIRMTANEWDKFRSYLIKKLEHTTLSESGTEIDSSWMVDEFYHPDPINEILSGKQFVYHDRSGQKPRVIQWSQSEYGPLNGKWMVIRIATEEDLKELPRY